MGLKNALFSQITFIETNIYKIVKNDSTFEKTVNLINKIRINKNPLNF